MGKIKVSERKLKRLQHLRDTGQDKRADKKQSRMLKPIIKHLLKNART